MKLYQVLEVISFITGLITYKALRPKFLQLIVLILGITVIHECLVIPYLIRVSPTRINLSYNIFSLIDMLTWIYIFFRILSQTSFRNPVIILSALSILYSLIELTVIKSWFSPHTDSFRFYEISLILFTLFYIYLTIKEEYHNLLYDPLFWVCCAIIAYHSILFLSFTTIRERNYWHLKNAKEVFRVLQTINNICYYVLLCITFIICKFKFRKKTLGITRK